MKGSSDVLVAGALVALGYALRAIVERFSWTDEPYKMVLVVNDELKMGKGKIGAQCAHAAVAVVERVADSQPHVLDAWEENGQAKICLRADSTATLTKLARQAKKAGLPAYLVADAGRTQVAPGSKTVLAIGPGPKSALDAITGTLKLL
ncbi:hypothetical protein QBZ16_003456 [Prototheca wickerhamii]|uniref:peptidyl-tRNA hydrolase n=1 Tax=Prototheca wickerhamii TaxID=3111 RepID=A0AAD9MNE7_PROWI|nr:hypothetical protein QBZ16_003456 [Prototheca wickerhamii]